MNDALRQTRGTQYAKQRKYTRSRAGIETCLQRIRVRIGNERLRSDVGLA